MYQHPDQQFNYSSSSSSDSAAAITSPLYSPQPQYTGLYPSTAQQYKFNSLSSNLSPTAVAYSSYYTTNQLSTPTTANQQSINYYSSSTPYSYEQQQNINSAGSYYYGHQYISQSSYSPKSFCSQNSNKPWSSSSFNESGYSSSVAYQSNNEYISSSPSSINYYQTPSNAQQQQPSTEELVENIKPLKRKKQDSATEIQSTNDAICKQNNYECDSVADVEMRKKKRSKIQKIDILVQSVENNSSQSVVKNLNTANDTDSSTQHFKCEICTAILNSAAKLLMHKHKYHQNGTSNQCPVCFKTFGNPANTLVHLRAHTQEKTYKCNTCSSAFCDSSTLKKHLRIHTGEKPYECRLCAKKFTQSGNLKRHLAVHSKYDLDELDQQQQHEDEHDDHQQGHESLSPIVFQNTDKDLFSDLLNVDFSSNQSPRLPSTSSEAVAASYLSSAATYQQHAYQFN